MKRIFCYGDSNTFGYDPRDYFGMPYERPWPLIASELSAHILINGGENGRAFPDSAYELKWFREDLDGARPLDLCMVMLGSNDLLMSLKPDVLRILEKAKQLVLYIKDECHIEKICMIAPPVFTHELAVLDEKRKAYSEGLKSLAKEMAIDYLDAACWQLPMAFDGVHLTKEAHEIFAAHIVEYLENI